MNRFGKSLAVALGVLCLLALPCGCEKKQTTTPSAPSSDAPSASAPSIQGSEVGSEDLAPSAPALSPSAPLPSSPEKDPSTPVVTEAITFSLGNIAGAAGEEITLPLHIENNYGVAGYSLTVTYDPEVLTFVSCQNKVPGGFATTNSVATPGQVRVMCTVMGGNKITLNDVCDLLTFKINDAVNAGTYSLDLIIADKADSVYRVEDGSMPNVDCSLAGATLTVHC